MNQRQKQYCSIFVSQTGAISDDEWVRLENRMDELYQEFLPIQQREVDQWLDGYMNGRDTERIV